jgi:GAF domain
MAFMAICALRLCAADTGGIQMREGDLYRMRAHYGLGREAVQHGLLQPLRLDRSSVTGRVALDGKIIQISDVLADPEYHATDHQQAFGYRAILGVPLLRDGTMIGVLSLTRDEVSPFTDKQIELVTTFADQAGIAMENARLLNELRESLEQQTATSDVLQVISRSPGELEPVFEAMLENAVRICGAKFGNLWLYDGEFLRIGATTHGAPAAYVEYLRREGPFRVRAGALLTIARHALLNQNPQHRVPNAHAGLLRYRQGERPDEMHDVGDSNGSYAFQLCDGRRMHCRTGAAECERAGSWVCAAKSRHGDQNSNGANQRPTEAGRYGGRAKRNSQTPQKSQAQTQALVSRHLGGLALTFCL